MIKADFRSVVLDAKSGQELILSLPAIPLLVVVSTVDETVANRFCLTFVSELDDSATQRNESPRCNERSDLRMFVQALLSSCCSGDLAKCDDAVLCDLKISGWREISSI